MAYLAMGTLIMRFKSNLVVLFVTLLLTTLWSATTPLLAVERLSIEHAVSSALEFDQRVNAANEALSATREGIRQAYGLKLPSISGTGDFNVVETQDFNENGTLQQDGTRYSAGLQLRQQLFTFGRQGARQAIAAAQVNKAVQELALVQQTVAMETIEAFFEISLSLDVIVIYQNHLNTLNQLLEATQAKFESDLSTATDVMLVRSRVQQAKAQLITAQAQLNVAHSRILSLTGEDFSEVEKIGEALRTELAKLNLEEAKFLAETYEPELGISRAEEEITRGQAKLDKTELYPSTALVARTSRGRTNGRTIGSDSIGLAVNIPLYDGGISRSRSRASKHRHAEARRQVTFALQRTQQRITGAWHQARGASETLEAWNNALAAELQSLEGIKEEVDEDLRPITYLLEARDQAVQVENLTARAKHDVNIAQFDFLKETGNLLIILLHN